MTLASQQLDIQALQQFGQQAQDDYQFAYAQYRLAVTASVRADEVVLKPALTAAADRLEQLVASEPAPTLKAEALALLALTRGMQAGYYPIKGMYYGQQSGKALDAATALQPQNPRVTLAAAILAYQTPTLFGGDKKAALSHAMQPSALSPRLVRTFAGAKPKPMSGVVWRKKKRGI